MAGRYICPVCDRRLKMKHFCTFCKSFVREPVYYTGPVANESYDSAGRPGCMADQHYGLGHVHSPVDRQKEYGHHKAGTGARQNPSARQSTYVNRSRPVQQSARPGQGAGTKAARPDRGQATGSLNYKVRPNAAQSDRSGQKDSRQQTWGINRGAKKFLAVFWVFILLVVLGQVIFSMIGYQGTGLSGDVFYFVPFTFFVQFLGLVFQVGIWALIVWVIVRNIRRK